MCWRWRREWGGLWTYVVGISGSGLQNLAASLAGFGVEYSDCIALLIVLRTRIVWSLFPISARCISLYCPCSVPYHALRSLVYCGAVRRIIDHALALAARGRSGEFEVYR